MKAVTVVLLFVIVVSGSALFHVGTVSAQDECVRGSQQSEYELILSDGRTVKVDVTTTNMGCDNSHSNGRETGDQYHASWHSGGNRSHSVTVGEMQTQNGRDVCRRQVNDGVYSQDGDCP